MAGRTSHDRIERFASRMDAKLRADEQSQRPLRVVTDSSLRVVMRECGFEKRGSKNVALIEAALAERGVYTDPPLTWPDLKWEQRVYFSRTPPSRDPEVRRVAFPTEHKLGDFIEANFDYLLPGLDLEGREYPIGDGRADLVAREREGFVVIELKLGRPTDRVVNQLLRYMDDLADWLSDRGRDESVRGLIIAGEDEVDMRDRLQTLATAEGRTIGWMTYRLDLELRPSGSPHVDG